jgi:uncharacterized protein
MSIKAVLESIREEAQRYFVDARGSHDWSHTERVYNLCMHIGKKENANLYILALAAFLHDIGREQQDSRNGKVCHAVQGALLARELLDRYNLDEKTIERIIHCIESHRFRSSTLPRTIEAQVLYDADKLDSIGAIGIGRAFLFAGEVGAYVHNRNPKIEATQPYTKEDTAYREFSVKLRCVKETMMTGEGKKLAVERHRFMEEFFSRLEEEVEGNL